MAPDDQLEQAVIRARAGERAALEEVVERIQDRVYSLSMRMLGDPADARDAAQEILIKVITHLGAFRGEAAFTTWVHQIASRHLVRWRRAQAEAMELGFESLGGMIDEGLQAEEAGAPDAVLTEEVRISCTQGMLLCLDRDHRLAYLLGEVFELGSDDGAFALDITPEAFRKRLSRARAALVEFMRSRCGVYGARNPCRCSIQVPYTIRRGMLDPSRLRFATHPRRDQRVDQLVGLMDAAAIYRSHPDYAAPQQLARAIKDLLEREQQVH
jgi:RNA polymerase sigma factor (sigma-70 family)